MCFCIYEISEKDMSKSMKFKNEVSNDRQVCQQVDETPSTVDLLIVFLEIDPSQISDISFNFAYVQNVPNKLYANKAARPDEIPMMFYKNLSASLCLPLSMLFNKSLNERKYPSKWKISFVSPNFKSADKGDITNYRAVRILSSISKVFEKLMLDKLFRHVKTKNVLHSETYHKLRN